MRFLDTVMGIPMSLDIRDAGDHHAAAKEAFALLHEADAIFSPYLPGSQLSRLNRGELTLGTAGALFLEVHDLAARFAAVSGGVFSLQTASGDSDLNGTVKGWAAQRAAQRLRTLGLANFCLNAGGDVVVAGGSGRGTAWNVGIRSPDSPQRMMAVLALRDMAVATSATYERGEHIIDGRTGLPACAFASVSVVAADLTIADVLATTVFAMGPDGPRWAAERYDCSVLAQLADGTFIDAGELRRWLVSAPK
ncbi:FAD:protein FMN transferase [Arthrobacter sp. STN4]|uniref:FAD:protein FMN transferase n=1 Tax=Arthrobacter sp. STN4 TaxID=2923276 RepID=UPI002119F948|nr:FAD:protein FMN transferase [Arthrobacter sp. STN4]MCQ9164211.1 FAD:protein FMN transferase [Arthrobacter sp. STN4]